ncbi:Thiamine-monophosphate kinase [Ferriphaselus amnicola]|uniref:Thiamine-monophosphate kinase n=1 Tax=Ferriphaselus amnicola TaxID=1188319 RepID=A0A2Z6GA24_9PROT|nr:thiamine-phosphate kinase [Ferriphaselus amnicola]BBE50302.1 Thiamine-monophosphate kinase [Ferriphaselus amnicola]
MSEFSLIRRYFTRATPGAVLGVGDDAALLQVSAGHVLAISTDMLVSGTHFFPDADPFLLGHKTLAVNLSDLAAMGAKPRWATLAISLPQVDDVWLERFAAGFFALAEQQGVDLVGGDTTRGPLNLCVTIMGEVPPALALRRDGAKLGDDIWVSGSLGDAALALAHLQERVVLDEAAFAACATRLHQPQPRVELGLVLRGLAHSAIDISDGLLADLGHILEASKVGAELRFDALPVSEIMSQFKDAAMVQRCILAGGDDYELCFTAPESCREALSQLAATLTLPLTRIGKVTSNAGCVVRDVQGNNMTMEAGGYDHFA